MIDTVVSFEQSENKDNIKEKKFTQKVIVANKLDQKTTKGILKPQDKVTIREWDAKNQVQRHVSVSAMTNEGV